MASLAFLAMVFVGCDSVTGGGGVPATSVVIFHNNQPAPERIDLRIYPYGTPTQAQLEARLSPAGADSQGITWSSSHPNVADVSNGGLVTAGGTPGFATITVTTSQGGLQDSVQIRVRGEEIPTVAGEPSAHAGSLLILHAGAGVGGHVGRSFVELYNTTDIPIALDGFSLQWATGTGEWDMYPLEGTVPGRGSFLVLGGTSSHASPRLQISNDDADMYIPVFALNNRAFRIAIMESLEELTVPNPFDVEEGGTDMRGLMPDAAGNDPSGQESTEPVVSARRAENFVDMLGVVNDRRLSEDRDIIHGAETVPAWRVSNQESVRRTSLDDTDNNYNDFRGIRWEAGEGAVADDQIAVFRPRGSAAGAWTPEFPEPNWEPPVVDSDAPTSETVIILQANRFGNNNGGAGGFPRTLVELFNLTDAPINLYEGNYFLHIRNATAWTHAIRLTGTIPARSSFLIASTTDINTAPAFATEDDPMGRAVLPTADQYADWTMPNGNFVVALLVNQPNPLGADVNPFTAESLWPYYVDMLGATSSIFEGSQNAQQSAPQGPRRTSLVDTNSNRADFAQADFRGVWPAPTGQVVTNATLYRIWPRNSSAGAWDPMTGAPAVHPTVRHPTSGVIVFPESEAPAPSGVAITGTGVASGALTVNSGGNVTLSAQFEPLGASAGDVAFAWAVTAQTPAGVLTHGAANTATFEITGAAAGTATVTLSVSGGGITNGPLTSSINVTVQEPLSSDGVIAAWNHTGSLPSATTALPATSGTNMAGTTLEFFYASGTQATFNTGGVFINVPNASITENGWFPGTPADPAPITLENSAGWVITLSTTGYENITFSAYQSASNQGPSQFRLAYWLDENGTWTEFGDMVTIPGGAGNQDTLHPTITNVSLPSAVENQGTVQIKVWLATRARRSDGGYTAPNWSVNGNGNHSINNIVFTGDEI